MSWRDLLQPASFRGVPFAVLGGDSRFGRRNAVHEYPQRDEVWVEDLGRAARRIRLVGFIVGDDVLAQRELMVAACEAEGDGELVHPTLGTLTVSLLDLEVEERFDQGRVFELRFAFIEAGKRLFPSAVPSTGDRVFALAGLADVAGAAAFVTRVAGSGLSSLLSGAVASVTGGLLQQGAAVVSQAVATVAPWVSTGLALARDATGLTNMVAALPGSFGRYFGGSLAGGLSIGRVSLGAGISLGGGVTLGGGVSFGPGGVSAGLTLAGGVPSVAAELGGLATRVSAGILTASAAVPQMIALGSRARAAVSDAADLVTSTVSELAA